MSDKKIVVDGISKHFGTLPVVGGVSFDVRDGEFVAIVGPSGCGKSTLLNIIAGFERPDGGKIRIDGVERVGPSRNGIMISQHGSVFPWLTVQENLLFGLSGASQRDMVERADRYIAMVGLAGFEAAYPHELSGGMLKRVELARALVVKPEILDLDEPFSALDAQMSLRMQIELRRILDEEQHTVLQNVMFGLTGARESERMELANRYIAMVGLSGFEKAYAHELSGGMLKRVELARALVVKPEILYMDEPFSALDALMSLKMQTELRRILEEERHTVLLITHDVEEAIYLADRILVLSPRPTAIQTIFDVDLPHPRKLSDPRAQELREAILKELGL